MNETTISLPDETVNYLQRLDYELAGLQVLHTHALKAGTPLEKRMEIRREFQETFAEYQMAKNEMWAEFAPRFPNAARWWVDFQSGELHVVDGECRGAQCAPAYIPPRSDNAGDQWPPLHAPTGVEGGEPHA